jgi:hypothetical protein
MRINSICIIPLNSKITKNLTQILDMLFVIDYNVVIYAYYEF